MDRMDKFLSEKYQLYTDSDNRRWAANDSSLVSKAQARGHKLVAVAGVGARQWDLVSLDNFDKQWTAKVKLKPGEKLYRSVSKHPGILPLVKVNPLRGLMWFLTDRAMSGEIDEPEFETKSTKLNWMRVLEGGLREETELDETELTELKKFDDVLIKSKNQAGIVYNIIGSQVIVKTPKGLVKTKIGDLKMMGEAVETIEKKVKLHNISIKYGKKGTLTRPPEGYIKDNKGMYQKVSDADWKKSRLKEDVIDEGNPKVDNKWAVYNAKTKKLEKVYTNREAAKKAAEKPGMKMASYVFYNDTIKESNNELSTSINDIAPTGAAVQDAKKIAKMMKQGKSFQDSFAGLTKYRTKTGAHKIGVINALKKMGVNVKHVSEETLNELSPETKKSYLDKAKKQVKELKPWTKKGEYRDLAKNAINRREKGMSKVHEAKWKVDVEGLPTTYVDADSAGQVKVALRRILKKPQDIVSVTRVNDAKVKKDLRDRISGKEDLTGQSKDDD